MADAYGWSGGRKLPFNGDLLDQASKELLARNHGDRLAAQLADALVPEDVFGQVPGGAAAASTLQKVFAGLQREIGRLGIDINDLAARTLAAGNLAHDVDAETRTAARGGADPSTGRRGHITSENVD